MESELCVAMRGRPPVGDQMSKISPSGRGGRMADNSTET